MGDWLEKYPLDLTPDDIMSVFQKWNLLLNELSRIQSINKKLLNTYIPRPVLGTILEKTLPVWLCVRYKISHNLSAQYIFCYSKAT